MTEDSVEFHQVLLDEVAWSFDEKKYSTIEEFYQDLQKYNIDIENELSEEVTYSLDIDELKISFNYTVEKNDEWVDIRKSVIVRSKYQEFNELELLFELHNSIQNLFTGYDHKFLEGLELLDFKTSPLEYELILGS